jgi:23S rRNA pseudouridine1911/1915/1917 synthase
MTLLEHLRREFPTAKKQTLKRMVENRRVTIDGRAAARLDEVVPAEGRVAVGPARVAERAARLPFEIVYEDGDVLVIDKPAGLLTSTGPRERRPTAIAAVREYLARTDPAAKPGVVHRLDRDASGLLVFAKSGSAFNSLKAQFFHHTVHRVYQAIVSPAPRLTAARIETRLIERADGTVHSARGDQRGQRAETHFSVAKRRGDFALLRVTLHTGRKHQIRAHLAEIGSPILGDEDYGGKKSAGGLMLAAVELGFEHPRTARRMEFQISESKNRVLSAFIAIGTRS